MRIQTSDEGAATIPRNPRARRSRDENLDEPGKLIEQEATDVEAETPDNGNASVERIEEDATPARGFEDDESDAG